MFTISMSGIRKVALIIGIDVYDNKDQLYALPSCKKDAEDLYHLLSSPPLGFTIFKNDALIGSNLDKEYGWTIIRKCITDFFIDAKPSHILLFYFSGHGIPWNEEVYLGTPQVDPKKPISAGISLSDLAKLMHGSKSKQIVCIIDACYSGAANLPDSKMDAKSIYASSAGIASDNYDKIWERIPKAKGNYLLLSSQAYGESFAPRDTIDNSLYTKYLIEGLGGVETTTEEEGIPGSIDESGNVTPETLHNYIYNKVASQADQIPKIKVDESSTVILANYADKAKTPNAMAWFLNEGNKYLVKRNYPDAILSLDRAIEIYPNYAALWIKKARALIYLGEYGEALKCFDKAIELKPNDEQGWNDKAYALVSLDKYDEAIKCFDKAIEIEPQYTDGWLGKAYALVSLGKYDEAFACYDKCIMIEPDYQIPWKGKGYVLNSRRRFVEAIKCFDKAIELKPNDEQGWNDKAYALVSLGKYDEASKCFDKAIELKPNDEQGWNDKAYALVSLDKYDEAIKCFDKAIEIEPQYTDGWLGKAYALVSLGKYDEASKCFDKAIELKPNDEGGRQGKNYVFFDSWLKMNI
jgi:tetratricopeptide (TPR) repeat protein